MTTDEMIARLESVVAELDERRDSLVFDDSTEADYGFLILALDALDDVIEFVKGLEE